MFKRFLCTVCALSFLAGTSASATEVVEQPSGVVSMCVVGDNLIHSPIYNKARKPDGGYDFKGMYSNVKDVISMYDIAVINEETVLVDDASRVSSYPCFGTPIEMGDAIIDAGFDVVLSATNHTWDKGRYGVETVQKYYKDKDVSLLGVNESSEEWMKPKYVEKNGIRFAFFNATYGLNGFKLPKGSEYMVNLLDDKARLATEVAAAKQCADFVVCFLHFGNEYQHSPSAFQTEWSDALIDAGADVIVGAHPHVVQPFGRVVTKAGNEGLVYWSLGNFISAQSEYPRMLGGMASMTFIKDKEGASVKDEAMVPLVTHYNGKEHSVYFLGAYTNELARTHRLAGKGLSIESLWNLWQKVVG